jgi:hypothetical protein
MEKLKGKIKHVRFSAEVSGGEKNTSTSHIAIFKLDNKPVELKLPGSILIEDGDNILVAGKTKNGLFKALAYNNLSNGVSGKGQVVSNSILGIFFTIVGIGIGAIPFFVINSIHGQLWALKHLFFFGESLIFVSIGISLIHYSRQQSKSFEIVANGF